MITHLTTMEIVEYIHWVLGNGTWYYYLPVLLVCFVISKYILVSKAKNPLLILFMSLTAASLTLGALGVDWLNERFATAYLNVFNWIGFFCFGVFLQEHSAFLYRVSTYVYAGIFVVLSGAVLHIYELHTYFHILSGMHSLGLVILVFGISYKIAGKNTGCLSKKGQDTYCIYLLHMSIVQFLCSKIGVHWGVELLFPFIALTAMYLLIFIGKFICSRIPFGNYILMLVGLK